MAPLRFPHLHRSRLGSIIMAAKSRMPTGSGWRSAKFNNKLEAAIGIFSRNDPMPIKKKDYFLKGYICPYSGFRIHGPDLYDIAQWIKRVLVSRRKDINLPTGGFIKGKHGMMGLEHLTGVWLPQHRDFERRFPGVAEKLFSPEFVRCLGFIVTDKKST